MPVVELPAAEPKLEATLAAAPEDTVHPEYVYLSRFAVLDELLGCPNAKIPTLAVPAAAPRYEAELAAVADDTTQPENVYLSRVVDGTVVYPNANMPTVPAATGVALPLAALNADGPYALLALTVKV